MLWKRSVRDIFDLSRSDRDIHPQPSWELYPQRPSRPWVHVILFLATVLTTTAAGAMQEGINPFTHPFEIYRGIPFSGTLLLILGVHEFGHYFASRKWGVRATLPYFIPVPPPFPIGGLIGTLGAVIKIKSPIPNKKALVEIGAAGPLSGFVVALVASVVGLRISDIVETTSFAGRELIILGDSLLSSLLSHTVIGDLPPGHDVILHPIAFAGWLGLFVTAMNLLPIGQLDGGHITYSLFGRKHGLIAKMSFLALFPLGIFKWFGWLFFAFVLIMVLGRGHPPPYDPYTPLDGKRKVIGYLAILVFILCFIPAPIRWAGGPPALFGR